jgi:glycosyltransferase involved in cell wall biosynthesis
LPAHDAVFFSPYLGPLLRARSGAEAAGSTGGAETQVFLVARELAARGWKVAVAAFATPDGLPGEVEGITVIPLPAPPPGGPLRRPAAWARLLIAVWRGLDGEVLVQRAAGAATALVGGVARLRRRRFVYSSANVIDFDFGRLERSGRAVRLFHLGTRLADAVIVQSAEQAELCRRAFGRSADVVLSIAEPAPLRESEPEAFLWIGRLAPYKRPEAMLELAARLPQARFWIVGSPSPLDPALAERMRRDAAQLPNVELLAPRPRQELAPLIERAVAIVNTSDFEGMPNVFLEGWMRGVPALTLTHDPDGVVTRERLGWFADGDVDRFAAQAAEAWRTRAGQDALARRCRDHVRRRHGPDVVAAGWERVLFGRGRSAPAGAEQAQQPAARGAGQR